MEQITESFLTYVESGGLFAPLVFIFFHLLRPFLFLPVVLICISGGLFFGTVAGTLYSVIGITLSSITFYFIYQSVPQSFRFFNMSKKWQAIEEIELTPTQITLLKLIPFIHFHFLSLCLIEISSSFRDYTKLSLFSNIPAVLMYTTVGRSLANLSGVYLVIAIIILLTFVFLLRKRERQIKWHDFFQVSI